MRADRPPLVRRLQAATALAALAGIAVVVGLFLYDSRGLLLALILSTGCGVAAAVALGWWAVTTSRAWKRRLNVSLAVLAVTAAVLLTAVASVVYAFLLLAVAVLAAVYVGATRRAVGCPPARVVTTAARPVRPWLLVNPRSGDGAADRVGLIPAARTRGVEVHVLSDGDDPAGLAAAAVAHGADAIGVAGGDGSLGAVAGAALSLDVPFFCVPTGTRNHFARDLGLRRRAPLAALTALEGVERRIDAGTVGGRVFLNNVSLGAYATMVHEPRYRGAKLGTARSVLVPAVRGEAAPVPLSFADGTGGPHDGAFVLLVANNPYELRSWASFGVRRTLDAGTLQVTVLQATTGAGLAGALMSRRDSDRTQWATTTFTVRTTGPATQAPTLPAAIDGEAVTISAPVEFGLLPAALRVLVPADARPPRAPTTVAFRWATVRALGRLVVG